MKDLFNDLQPPVAISLDRLDPNEGQLQEQGLPGNPRDIKDEKYELLKENIKKYPEFLRQNSLIVYPYANDRFIIIGGNMRYHALKELGFDKVPCSVLPADTPIERLKAFIVLDNSSFGKWDWDKIANEWDADELTGWGVDLPIMETDDIDPDDFSDEFSLPDGEKEGMERVAFILSAEQAEFIKEQLKIANAEGYETFGNTNSNGNALYSIVKEWADVRK